MSEPADDDREQRLSGLARESLDAYERGEIGLTRLVANVESAIEALLDIADVAWVEELRSAWSGLEIVHALALDDGRRTLTDGERGEIAETIAELRSLLAR